MATPPFGTAEGNPHPRAAIYRLTVRPNARRIIGTNHATGGVLVAKRTLVASRVVSVLILLMLVVLGASAVSAQKAPLEQQGPWPCQPGASDTAICGHGISCEWMGHDAYDRRGDWWCAFGGTDCMFCHTVIVING